MANGTIAFDTLSTSDSVNTGTTKSIDTSYIFNGVPKAWGNFNQATARDSFNISSATDQATGNYLYIINNDMTNTDYAVVTQGARNEDAVIGVRDTEMTAAQFQVLTHNYSASDVDSDSVFFGVLGDLA
tara:strand:+ start:297 stop:683 length:387 start_codon:yes stop_codon:yes gene_type:complete